MPRKKKVEPISDETVKALVNPELPTTPLYREGEVLEIVLPFEQISKKNHGQIVMVKGYPRLIPAKAHQEWLKSVEPYFVAAREVMGKPIDYPVNLKCIFYRKTKRPCDIINLMQAVQDALVKYEVIMDDNFYYVCHIDGCECKQDKINPRTEIIITPYDIDKLDVELYTPVLRGEKKYVGDEKVVIEGDS